MKYFRFTVIYKDLERKDVLSRSIFDNSPVEQNLENTINSEVPLGDTAFKQYMETMSEESDSDEDAGEFWKVGKFEYFWKVLIFV